MIRRQHALLAALVLALASALPAWSATVRLLAIDDLVDDAALVFHGRVVDVRTVAVGRLPSTRIEFEVIDVVKGDPPGERVVLEFLGGSAGGRTVVVPGSRFPTAGEEGIYFVASLVGRQVNPLLGWSQGHFLVREDSDGTPRVYSADELPVTALERATVAPTATSEGVARGVVSSASSAEPLTPSAFKGRLRTLLGESR